MSRPPRVRVSPIDAFPADRSPGRDFLLDRDLLAGPLRPGRPARAGWLALKKWKRQESVYGAKASTVRAWIGIVTGGLGTLPGIAVVALLLLKH